MSENGWTKIRDGLDEWLPKIRAVDGVLFVWMLTQQNRKRRPLNVVETNVTKIAERFRTSRGDARRRLARLELGNWIKPHPSGWEIVNPNGKSPADHSGYPMGGGSHRSTGSRRSTGSGGSSKRISQIQGVDPGDPGGGSRRSTKEPEPEPPEQLSAYGDVLETLGDGETVTPSAKRARKSRAPSAVVWDPSKRSFELKDGGEEWKEDFISRWGEFFTREEITNHVGDAKAWCMRPKNEKRVAAIKRWDDFLDRWLQKALGDRSRGGRNSSVEPAAFAAIRQHAEMEEQRGKPERN